MTEAEFRAWMDAYGRAFEGTDPEAAAALFTADATYRWGPFGELLRGPEEIRERWSRAFDPDEENVRFEYEVLAVTDEVGIARWMASSAVPARRKLTRWDGVFAVSLRPGGLCNEFREWWNTLEEPL